MPTLTDTKRLVMGNFLGYTEAQLATKSLSQLEQEFWEDPDLATLLAGNVNPLTDIWLPASAFHITFGAPVMTALAGWPGGYSFPNAAQTVVGTYLHGAMLGGKWATYHADLWWAAAGAGVAEVLWRFGDELDAAGSVVSGGYDAAQATTNVPGNTAGTEIPVVTRVGTSRPAPTVNQIWGLRVDRMGADDASALAVKMLGLRLSKAS